MVDPYLVRTAKKAVQDTLEALRSEHCPDCHSGDVRATFHIAEHGGLEFLTVCPNCGKRRTY